MPLYEYICDSCGAEFEAIVATSRRDDPETTCPVCGKCKFRRKISVTAKPKGNQCASCSTCSGGACSTCGP
ncbi:MAG TPA: zinc ribbon domain-containing protein [candidate division Zixibacteria bacterium]|nr:zinc ribbon domain-containing protein [candidate division Zixibacteria bacterium]